MSTSCLKHGNTTASGTLQVTRDGVVHMAFHPRSDAIILAAGDKGGRLGIWHLDHDSFQVTRTILMDHMIWMRIMGSES